MGELKIAGKSLAYRKNESVLDCLQRHQIEITSSCRSGVCQSCLIQGSGNVPALAQKGVAPGLRKQNFFLACQCPAAEDIEIISAAGRPLLHSRIVSVESLSPQIIRVKIFRPPELSFEAGQFIEVIRPSDKLSRSYSIASLPCEDMIELHVAVLNDGRMSQFLKGGTEQELLLRGPSGDCFYSEEYQDEPLLLAGTGTGAAPLWGIVQQALALCHAAPIQLFLGALTASELYLREELQALASLHENFSFHLSALSVPEPDEVVHSTPLAELIKEKVSNCSQHRVFLCGNPDLVQKLRKQCFLDGAAMQNIHSDPFVMAK